MPRDKNPVFCIHTRCLSYVNSIRNLQEIPSFPIENSTQLSRYVCTLLLEVLWLFLHCSALEYVPSFLNCVLQDGNLWITV